MPKTIFGTTEKSNFILNMPTQRYHRYNLWILLSFLILMPVLSLPLEFSMVYSLPIIALALSGVAAIVFVFIGFMKSATPKGLWLLTGIAAAMVAWGYVSLLQSFYVGDELNFNTATFGADGRGEGLLSILFYGCFFLLGAQLGSDGNRRKLLSGMLLMGLAECVWGLLQALPIGFPSYYQNLEPLLLFRTFLPSGLTGSPIFLATLLAMLEVPAMLMAAFTEDKKWRTVYLVCAAAFALMAVKTQCLIGLAGMGLAIVIGTVYLLWKKAGKQGIAAILAAVIAFGAGLGWSIAAPVINGTTQSVAGGEASVSAGLRLYDGAIMWEDGAYRLTVSGYYLPSAETKYGSFSLESVPETYGYLWKAAADIAAKYPLTGTGPDSLAYAQLYSSLNIMSNPNVFDRAYDFYLHTAATLGFPMLAMVLALLVTGIVRGGRTAAYGTWLDTAILGAVVVYEAVMIAGVSSITVAPLFWMLLGCCVRVGTEQTRSKKGA